MDLSILLFGIARDIVGDRSVEITLPEQENVAGLMIKLKEKYPGFNELKSLFIAVNDEYAPNDKLLAPGDEVALIPPVSGG
jgi:molybdopterin converting factor subunit 1